MTEAEAKQRAAADKLADIRRHVESLAVLAKEIPVVAASFYDTCIARGFSADQATTLTAAWLGSLK